MNQCLARYDRHPSCFINYKACLLEVKLVCNANFPNLSLADLEQVTACLARDLKASVTVITCHSWQDVKHIASMIKITLKRQRLKGGQGKCNEPIAGACSSTCAHFAIQLPILTNREMRDIWFNPVNAFPFEWWEIGPQRTRI